MSHETGRERVKEMFPPLDEAYQREERDEHGFHIESGLESLARRAQRAADFAFGLLVGILFVALLLAFRNR